jgi:hypothetical protein
MIALISPFQAIIESLPTRWTELIDRPEPVSPSTSEAIAFSLTPARMVLAALEKFSSPEPEATEPEPYTHEAMPDYWEIATQPELEPVAIAPKPVTLKTQLCLPAAKEEVKPYPTVQERAAAAKKRQAEYWANQRAIATPTMQPDGETPNLSDYFPVGNATGQFSVKPHSEGHIVKRWKKTKRQGWQQTTHLISQHGCDCEQARKKPSSVCCHQKALKSFQLSEKTRLQKEEWDRQSEEKRAKTKAELDAIAAQRAKDAEAKLTGLIRTEAQSGKRPQAIGLQSNLTYAEQRSRALADAQILIMECSFNRGTGEAFLTERYSKKTLQAMELDELQDLIEHLTIHQRKIKKANLKDVPLAQSGLRVGDLCKAKKTGYRYQIKALKDDGMATLQTLTGNFEAFLPIDRLEAI